MLLQSCKFPQGGMSKGTLILILILSGGNVLLTVVLVYWRRQNRVNTISNDLLRDCEMGLS